MLVFAPPQMDSSGGFTKTIPTLLLLSLLFSGTQPWLRVLLYFLHTLTHGRSSLSPAETKSSLQTSSVLPAGLGPLTHHIPEVHLKTPGICTQTQPQGKQRTNKHQDAVGYKVSKCECSYLPVFPCIPNRAQGLHEMLPAFVSKTMGPLLQPCCTLASNGYLLSTYTGGEQSCQILLSLPVVRHQ